MPESSDDRDDVMGLQKWLQAMGVAGKAAIREAIREGRVSVDGSPETRYARPLRGDEAVSFEGRLIRGAEDRSVWLMNKPKKHVTGRVDPEGRPTLEQYLPEDAPWIFPVGRLDFNTEGALLWTNDGQLARRVLHPSWDLPKTYRVKVRGPIAEDDPGFGRIREGLSWRGETYQPAEARWVLDRTRASWIEIVLREGKFREIRRMCHANRWQIVKLRRIAIGPVSLGDLNPRCIRKLTDEEIQALDLAVGLDPGSTSGPS